MSAEEVLREIEQMSRNRFLPIVGPHKAEVLRSVIREKKPKTVLEVGTLIGYSAIVIASELLKDGMLICMEIDDELANIAIENLARAELLDKVKVLIGDAKELIQQRKEKFDMVFIDAIKEEYLDYLKLAEKNLSKNAVIVADNVKEFADILKDYLDYVRNSGKYTSEYKDVPASGDAMEVSIKAD